jgi:hypothetical protein
MNWNSTLRTLSWLALAFAIAWLAAASEYLFENPAIDLSSRWLVGILAGWAVGVAAILFHPFKSTKLRTLASALAFVFLPFSLWFTQLFTVCSFGNCL